VIFKRTRQSGIDRRDIETDIPQPGMTTEQGRTEREQGIIHVLQSTDKRGQMDIKSRKQTGLFQTNHEIGKNNELRPIGCHTFIPDPRTKTSLEVKIDTRKMTLLIADQQKLSNPKKQVSLF
jgi:hypothetical protein